MANAAYGLAFGPVGKGLADMFGNNKSGVDPYGALNPDQRQLSQALGPQLTSAVNAPYTNYLYPGQTTAPITQGEQDVVNNSSRMNAVAGKTYDQLATYDPQKFNQDFNNEIQDPTFANFKNNIEPYLAQEIPSFGTARANVVARNLTDLQNNLLQQRFTSNQAAKDTAINALNSANTYNQGAEAIAAVPRVIQQAGLDAQYNNFIQANQQKQNSVNQALNFLGISTGTYQQPPDQMAQLINLLKTGAQVASVAGGV